MRAQIWRLIFFLFLPILLPASPAVAIPTDSGLSNLVRPQDQPFQDALNSLIQGRLDEADRKFEQILKSNPRDVYAILGRAQIALERQKTAEAEKNVRAALAIDPNAPVAHNMLGIIRLSQKNNAQAKAQFQKAIQLNPKFWAPRMNLAAIYLAEKKPDLAIQEYRSVLKSVPGLSTANSGLADAYLAKGARAEAIKVLQTWRGIDPKDPLAPDALGLIYFSQKDYGMALNEFDAALRINPKFFPAIKDGVAIASQFDVRIPISVQ